MSVKDDHLCVTCILTKEVDQIFRRLCYRGIVNDVDRVLCLKGLVV